MKTVAIIQARMGSTRLPGKVLADLCGIPMLAVLLHRLRKVRGIDDIVVATTTSSADDILVDWLEQQSVSCYRGSEDDVLDRYWQCARMHGADIVVRVTADDPLKDPEVIEMALSYFRAGEVVDYVSNTIRPTYPEGLDIEVFSFASLDRAAREANLLSEREHVTPYIWTHPERFVLRCFEMTPNLSSWRWTVDKPEDLQFVRTVLAHFDNNIDTSYKDIIAFLQKQPELMKINLGTVRNEGYLKTLSLECSNECQSSHAQNRRG